MLIQKEHPVIEGKGSPTAVWPEGTFPKTGCKSVILNQRAILAQWVSAKEMFYLISPENS